MTLGRKRAFAAAVCGAVLGGVMSPGIADAAGATGRVSLTSSWAEANDHSRQPFISTDGRFVVFTSPATNLGINDTNRQDDVFVRDRQAASTSRMSVATISVEVNNASYWPSISDDGLHVTFASDGNNLLLATDTNGATDVFVRDRTASATKRMSITSSGAQSNGPSYEPLITPSGRFVVFTSDATNLVSGDLNGSSDIFVRDRDTNADGRFEEGGNVATRRVSLTSLGSEGTGSSKLPSISSDGRFVVFQSEASNLAPDTNATWDTFLHDRDADGDGVFDEQGAISTSLVSASTTGVQGNSGSFSPSISADGRYIAFESDATNLVLGDLNGLRDVFVYDRVTSTTTRASVSDSEEEANGPSGAEGSSGLSGDGRLVVFRSGASNLVAQDGNVALDTFVRDMVAGTTTRVSISTNGLEANGASDGEVSISRNGRFVAFASLAPNLVPGDANNKRDVFTHELTGAPDVIHDPGSINFGNKGVGSPGPSHSVTVTNAGTSTLNLGALILTGAHPGDFVMPSDTCSNSSVAPGASCQVSLAFWPTVVGARQAVLTIPSNAALSPHQAALSGNGMEADAPLVSIKPSSLDYGARRVGTTSTPKSVTITNSGSLDLVLGSLSIEGPHPGDFLKTSDVCGGATLQPEASCVVGVAFAPTDEGGRSAVLTIPSNAPGAPHSVGLSGVGLVDRTAPSTTYQTLIGTIFLRSQGVPKILGRTADDLSGVAEVEVILTSAGNSVTVKPALACGMSGLNCTWSLAVPVGFTGPVLVAAHGTDVEGNVESPSPMILVFVF